MVAVVEPLRHRRRLVADGLLEQVPETGIWVVGQLVEELRG
ncbi:MAG: hypothetical protein ACRDQD_24465 [Nocardioidaceae bacterium]